jgi:hypothetical protein
MSQAKKTIFAHTEPGACPAYINITKNADGTTTVSVRSEGCSSPHSITLGQAVIDEMTDSIIEGYYVNV